VTAPAATSAPPGTRELELTIGGMTCAACAARVEKKLNKLADVRASVNYATATAAVTAPSGLPVDVLTDAVQQAGYTAAARQEQAPADAAGEDSEAGRHFADLKRRLIVAVILFVPLTELSLVLSLAPGTRFPGWQWLLVACGAPVALWCAWPFHRAALKNARNGSSSMDTLVSLGIIAACGWSVYAMFVLDPTERGGTLWQHLTRASGGGIYLETAATVTTFLLAGRLYEARARRIAGQAMRDLEAAAAKDVCVIGPDGTERFVPVRLLRPGDSFRVLPGETIAADGEVLFGQTAVDRSMMTGESVPADVDAGDTVTGGTVALTGRLVVRAIRVGQDTQLSHLIRLVEQAQAAKASVQRIADRVCGIFVPAILCAAAVTLAGWLLAGAPAAHAFSAGLAVLIIACPCALGLATPAALVAACGRGARLGIFIKGYRPLETSRSVKVVVLDKTGTVTTGQMSVTDLAAGDGTARAELLRYAGAVEQASEHAVAAAIRATAIAECGPLPQADGFRALPGLGARGIVDGHEVVVGREKLFADRGTPVPGALGEQCLLWERDGRTAVLIGWDGAVRGAVAVADTVKPSARAAVTRLRGLGLHPVLLTGDNEATARAVAAAVGIEEVIAGTGPDGKAEVIAQIQASGRPVAMVGDGVNDAPALSAADLGLALGSGTDVAICAADLILLSDDLGAVPDAVRLARATFRTIRVNLGWAFGYNVAVIPLAALGFLNPVLASAAMTLSSVFVVSNSLRLQRLRICPGEQHARLHARQGQLPPAAAARRRAGPRPAADDRGGQVLHRYPYPDRRGDQGAAGRGPGPDGGTSQPLRRPGDSRGRRRRRREDPRGLRRDRPTRSFLNAPLPADAVSGVLDEARGYQIAGA
jgi:P-type Cu+ transporter